MNTLEASVKDIKKYGFGYIKVELEAQLNRGSDDSDDEEEDCYECDGRGENYCDTCDGDGYVIDHTLKTEDNRLDCSDCDMSGYIRCNYCEGSGTVYSERDSDEYSSEMVCHEFILSHISNEARQAIIFSKFYNDGSVDSEFTFTISVDDSKYLKEYINAFSLLSREVGGEMEVDGAGMHIAVLPHQSNGRYPVSNFRLDSLKLANFRREVTKLLPALFLSAMSGDFTRELYYRSPQVSEDKYSAIHIVDDSCLEFRVFETCYQRPEAIFEFIGTIARLLEYYHDTNKKVASEGKKFMFFETGDASMFASTPEQVQIVKKQLKLVTPKGMTVRELQKNRGLKLSVTDTRKAYSRKVTRARKLWRENMEAYKTAIARELTESQRRDFMFYKNDGYYGTLSDDEIKARVLNIRTPEQDMEKFVEFNAVGHRPSQTILI